MGHVYQRVKLAAVGEEELSILIDTGATYSLISPALADRLGVSRLPRRQVVTLADGRRLEVSRPSSASSWSRSGTGAPALYRLAQLTTIRFALRSRLAH